MSDFTTDQVCALREIERARRSSGGTGLRSELQALINRLQSGGVGIPAAQPHGGKRRGRGKLPNRDPRILTQAKVLWDKGWGDVQWWKDSRGDSHGAKNFLEYLASIPDLPTFPETYDARFPHLVLVDRRPMIVEACRLLNVKFDGNNDTFVPYDPAKVPPPTVYWMRCQDGKINRKRKPSDCRTEFSSRGDELGFDAPEGLALYAQYPDLLEVNTAMDLLGSVHADDRVGCAFLRRWTVGEVKLHWYWRVRADPSFGSASRGDCIA